MYLFLLMEDNVAFYNNREKVIHYVESSTSYS